jgi:RND family efflux transporter MFP subunit
MHDTLKSAAQNSGASDPAFEDRDVQLGKSGRWNWKQSKALKAGILAVLILAAASPWIFKEVKKGHTWGADQPAPVTAPAKVAPFLQEVVERGDIESSSNIELRCQVQQGRGALGTAIIQIVPEGIYANKDDFLVKLDDSALRADLVQQQIACNTSRAAVTESLAEVESAKLALQEYESGTFRQEEQALESDEFVAKENLRRAEEYLRYSERLATRGYVTEVQLEADRFSVEKSRKELESAKTKIEVLHRLTKQKTLNKLRADVEIAEARLRSRENSFELDNEKLALIQAQIENCIIKAPTSGQVVYGKDSRNDTGEPTIAEGKLVRERQVIIRLPDPKRMKVIARINESRIDRVKVGMRARVKVDAFPYTEMAGTVRDVSEYPLPSLTSYSTIKEYAAEVEIHKPLDGLRVGMTARVSIEVEKLDSALQVPLPAVFQRNNRYFCIVALEGNRIEAREVAVGLANDMSVIIERGLSAGEAVVLAPQNYEEYVSLPPVVGKPKGRAPAAAKVATPVPREKKKAANPTAPQAPDKP